MQTCVVIIVLLQTIATDVILKILIEQKIESKSNKINGKRCKPISRQVGVMYHD